MIMSRLISFRGFVCCTLLFISTMVVGQLLNKNFFSTFLNSNLAINLASRNFISKSSAEKQIICVQKATMPEIGLSALTVTPLNYSLGLGPSASANLKVSGTFLIGDVIIKPNDDTKWEVSTDNVIWSNSATYIPLSGVLKASENRLYIRLKSGFPVGSYTGIITATSPNAEDKMISFTGEVLQPVIQLNQVEQDITFTSMDYNFAQGPSLSKSVKVDGLNLNEGITVSAPLNWEISSNAAYNGGNVFPFSTVQFIKNASNKNLYIRLKNSLPVGFYTGAVTFTSSNASTRTVMVSGTVFPAKVDMKVSGGTATITAGSTSPSSFNRTQFAARNIGDSQTKSYTITNKGGAILELGEINIRGANDIDFSINNSPLAGTELAQNQSVNFDVTLRPTTTGSKTAVVEIESNDPDNHPYDFTIAGKANFCGAASTLVIAQQGFEKVPEFEELTYSTNSSVSYGINTGFSTGKSTGSDYPSFNNLFSEGERAFLIQGGITTNTLLSPYVLDFNAIDTSIYNNIEFSIRIAAFSLGSQEDGVDNLDVNDLPTTVDSEKLDYLLIEISPDDGVTWFQQAKIVSDEPNLAWGFGPTGRVEGSRDYEPTNSLTYFKSADQNLYKKITILNLPAVTHLKIRISAQNNSVNESWIIDDVRLVSTGIVPKVWNGNTWLPSKPLKSDKIIINGDYNTATSGGSLQACQCEVNTATLTISENDQVIISDIFVNNGNVIVENNANFIQVNETAVNSGTGTFTVKRNAHLKRLDYNYWSSPVAGQNLKQFSTGTLNSRFYTYNESNDLFEMIDPLVHNFGNHAFNFESAAKGYAIRANNNYTAGTLSSPPPTQVFEGVFNGTVNNGPIGFPLKFNGNGFNLIGNPYASNIDFYSLANHNHTLIEKTAYFWTNLNPNSTMQGSNYPNGGYYNNYAILNGTGGIPATLGTNTNIKNFIPTRNIKVGQGFLVKAKQAGLLTFKNGMRSVSDNSVFFNKRKIESVEAPVDRYWLHLTSPLGVVSTTLIGYVENATNDYDADYDAPLFGLGADALFSNIDNRQLGIQGRNAPFVITDSVTLGTNHYAAGDYTIALGEREGVFANGQNIYLLDHRTGVKTNLSEKSYTYSGVAGLTENRFEIIYDPKIILGLQKIFKADLVIYREDNHFVLKSPNAKISEMEIFDSSGRLIYKEQPNNNITVIPAENLTQGVYIFKINLGGNLTIKKVLI